MWFLNLQCDSWMSIIGSHEYARGPKDIDTVMMLSAEIGRAVVTWFNTTIKFIIVFAVNTISKTRVYNCLGPSLRMLSRGLFIAFFGLGFPWLRPQLTWALSHVQSVLGVSRSLLRWRPKKDAPRAVLALLEGVVPLITHWWSTVPQARVLGQGKVIYYEVDGPIILFIYTMRHHWRPFSKPTIKLSKRSATLKNVPNQAKGNGFIIYSSSK